VYWRQLLRAAGAGRKRLATLVPANKLVASDGRLRMACGSMFAVRRAAGGLRDGAGAVGRLVLTLMKF